MGLLNTGVLAGKTVFITGGSRGIGKAIALKVAKDGANVVIAAKTADKHPKLEGTIYTTAEEVEANGGKCLPIQCDLRDEEQLKSAIQKAVQHFGGLDALVNNASAISLTGTEQTSMKKYDLMNTINARGTYMASKYAIPHLKKSPNPHILTLSPPLNVGADSVWFTGKSVAYTIAKYGMSMCALGMAAEFRGDGIAVNTLWPRTIIWTAAVELAAPGADPNDIRKVCRKVDIQADAAYGILSKNARSFTGNFLIDEEFLKGEGITDFKQYSEDPSVEPMVII
ncbi:unnamed protein product [Oppiella nova]|uniref:Hydroxysteroid dehydrogenase-like protein 2 n=2 Tax=Oppiella nova TaxID=334625 RepID=A0A7R9M632_9ACAR|nr:unnamed protein product [Oppiella nova]CAG2171183.1 unnamed protein product [Oppiella nova]